MFQHRCWWTFHSVLSGWIFKHWMRDKSTKWSYQRQRETDSDKCGFVALIVQCCLTISPRYANDLWPIWRLPGCRMFVAPHVHLRGRERLDGNVQIPHLSCERGENREISGVWKGGQEGKKKSLQEEKWMERREEQKEERLKEWRETKDRTWMRSARTHS